MIPILTPELLQHADLLNRNYLMCTGNPLFPSTLKREELFKELYNAPFALISHGIEADPLFNFANAQAQELWEMKWDEFITMPSRLSAEPILQSERRDMLERARAKGFINDYTGIRISKSGKRFQIINSLLWNLYAPNGEYKGQAALFREWKFL